MRKTLVFLVLTGLLTACSSDYTPKPRGYFRIETPPHEYRLFDSTFPYAFEYPVYATIEPDRSSLAEPGWINIRYPRFRAQLHLSYKPVRGNLPEYLDDSHHLVDKHIPKANAITRQEFVHPENKVYGLTFAIRGTEAASPYQFYLTDSVSHFLRGALYFNIVPNNDSLAPVIDFLKADIDHLISTLRWKN